MRFRCVSMLTAALIGLSLCSPAVLAETSAPSEGVVVHQTVKNLRNDERLDDLFFRPSTAEDQTRSDLLRIFPEQRRQSFIGVGGAMTEAAAYNIAKLSPKEQELVYEAYFGEDGAKYALLRSSIGSADFHTRSYSYVDTEEPDPELTQFSIEKDWEYIIPAIHRAQTYRPDLKFFAAPWAPPAWMKKSGVRRGQTGTAALSLIDNSLKKEYYESYANYFVKYMQAYEAAGIPVYSLSLQNEAQNNPKWEACTWSSKDTATFIGEHLGPALERNGLDPKLLIWDWDKGNDPMHGEGFIRYNSRVLSDPKARQYIDGIAFHWYAGDLFHEIKGEPMWSRDFYSLDEIKAQFPDIALYATEACQEKGPWWYSFDPADRYIYDILNDFEHGVESWIDWNLVLDEDGGPTQGVVNQCHAPMMLDSRNRLHFQPSYYILKRISREIQPGKVSIVSESRDASLVKTAAIDKAGQVSILLGNVEDQKKTVTLMDGEASLQVTLPPHSLTSLSYNTYDKPMQSGPIETARWEKPVAAKATSYERNPFRSYRAEQAIDGKAKTRWASEWQDKESITFELAELSSLDGIKIQFENGHDASFSLWTSVDGRKFKRVYFAHSNEFYQKQVEIFFERTEAKYLRFQGEHRRNRFGYSIYEVDLQTWH